MGSYYITHVRKDDWGNITDVKTEHHQFSLSEAIDMIEKGNEFFVRDALGYISVKVINREGRKYLRTVKDNRETDNLDNLSTF